MVRSIDMDNKDVEIPQVAMTKEEQQLRQASNGSPEDEELMQLILTAWKTERGTKKWGWAIKRLLLYVQKSPHMLRSTHRRAQEALNQTWIWLTKHIDDFDPTTPSKKGRYTNAAQPEKSLTDSFFRWVRTNLKWRLRDIIAEGARPFDPNFPPKLPSPDSDSIDRRLANDFTIKLEEYLENDPDGRLVACCMKQHPHCNSYELVARLLLSAPPMKKTVVAKELGVDYDAMYAHWNRPSRKLLKTISREIADSLGYDLGRQ